MTAESIEAKVIAFVAQVAEVRPERVTPTTRLLDDLGIDGDDAVELFNGLHEQFGTDLTHLYQQWSSHFGPEGLPLSTGLMIVSGAAIGALTFSFVNTAVGNLIAVVVGMAAATAAIAASIWIGRRLGLIDEVAPITVGEVISAVEAGAWPR